MQIQLEMEQLLPKVEVSKYSNLNYFVFEQKKLSKKLTVSTYTSGIGVVVTQGTSSESENSEPT